MIVREQRRHLTMRQDGGNNLAGHALGQQPITVLREDGWNPDPIVDAQSHEPTEQQIVVHLFHKLPIGAGRVEDLQQVGSDQTFRRGGGTTLSGVEPIKPGIQRCGARRSQQS